MEELHEPEAIELVTPIQPLVSKVVEVSIGRILAREGANERNNTSMTIPKWQKSYVGGLTADLYCTKKTPFILLIKKTHFSRN